MREMDVEVRQRRSSIASTISEAEETASISPRDKKDPKEVDSFSLHDEKKAQLAKKKNSRGKQHKEDDDDLQFSLSLKDDETFLDEDTEQQGDDEYNRFFS